MDEQLRSAGILRRAVLCIALVFLLVPPLCAAVFGFTLPGRGVSLTPLAEAFENPRAMTGIINSLLLTLLSTVGMLVLLVPTLIALHLKGGPLLRWAEALSVLPLVIPAIALVSGASIIFRTVFPAAMNSVFSLIPLYMVISLPLCYRTLDAGVRALDLRTLFAASISLGAGHLQTLLRVVLPNLRVAMLSASLICIAMLLSEYALASLLLHYTFPVFLVEVGQTSPRASAALSFLMTMVMWVLLMALSAISGRGQRSSTTARSTS